MYTYILGLLDVGLGGRGRQPERAQVLRRGPNNKQNN